MGTDSKLNVQVFGSGESLKIGCDVITLEDRSSTTYKTESIVDFVKYCQKFEACIYYTQDTIVAYESGKLSSGELGTLTPAAICTMKQSPYLDQVFSVCNKTLSSDQIETFLRTVARYLRRDGVELMGNVRNMVVSKVKTATRILDDHGNYQISYTSENHGNQHSKIPPKIGIEVPVFAHLPDIVAMEFDTVFVLDESGSAAPQMRWTLRNMNLSVDVENRKREIVEAEIHDFKDTYYGCLSIDVMTDSWKYLLNKMEL